MKHTKIIVTTTLEGTDLVSNALFEIGCNATAIIDAENVAQQGRTKSTEEFIAKTSERDSQKALVVGVLKPEESVKKIKELKTALAKLANNSPFSLGELSISESKQEEPDWTYVWQNFYPPQTVGRFKIFPEWHKNKRAFLKTPITIEVSDVFGTGHHPTTAACLEFMQKIDLNGKTVFDIGTGTGILAICAKKLGAGETLGTDITDAAIKSAKRNAKLNNVEFSIKKVDLLGGISAKADVILANLSSDLLLEMSKTTTKNMKKGGFLIASGIIPDRETEVLGAFEAKGFKLIRKKSDDDWTTVFLGYNPEK